MAREQPDRLAQGFVRDELRNLKKVFGDHPEGQPLVRLVNFLQGRAGALLRGKRLDEQARKSLRRGLHGFILENFLPFSHNVVRQPLSGIETPSVELNLYYYLQPVSHRLVQLDREQQRTDREFEEEAVEIRFLRFAVSGRRVILDDFSCNVTISGHALVRAISRRACESRPAEFMAENAERVLSMIPVILSTAIVVQEWTGAIIPMPKGVLVGDIAKNEQAHITGRHMRRRVTVDDTGIYVKKSPVFNPFRDPDIHSEETMLLFRVSTYLDESLLSRDQRWARDAMEAFYQRHEDQHGDLIAVITSPEIVEHARYIQMVLPIYRDYMTLIQDERWRRANRLG